MELIELPTEVLLNIVLRLPLRDIGRLIQTNRRFAFELLSPKMDSVWKTLAYRTWGSSVGDSISRLMVMTPIANGAKETEEIKYYTVPVAKKYDFIIL